MNDLNKLRELFVNVRNNPYSSFYKDFYAGRVPERNDFPVTMDEWRMIPVLTKADIQRVPPFKRVFGPRQDIDFIGTTSGTTSGRTLSTARSAIHIPEHEVLFAGTSTAMLFNYPPHMAQLSAPSMRWIGCDPTHLEASAVLARTAKIDAVMGKAAVLIAFAPYLEARMSLSAIRAICLSHDRCTAAQEREVRRLYPAARIGSTYASMEIGHIANTAPEHVGTRPFALRSLPDVYIETDPTQEGSGSGEIIVTTSDPKRLFPAIRYRTGDIGIILEQKDRTVFEIRGRLATDGAIRFAGGTILVDEIERALAVATDNEATDFEAAVTEEQNSSLPVLSIAVITKGRATLSGSEKIEQRLSATMLVNENRTYADAVAKGLCAPLICTLGDSEHGIDRKRRRLIDKRI